MSGRMTLKGIAILIAILILFNISISSYILLSDPYERVVAAYEKEYGYSGSEKVEMCLYCRKRISYASGFRIFRFTIVVKNGRASKKVPVVYRVSTTNGSYQVEFSK